jgi:pyruvate formate lyase activating enzyme
MDIPPTDAYSIYDFLQMGAGKGLKFLYGGNLADTQWSNTRCPQCHETLIERSGYHIKNIGLRAGLCRFCGVGIPGIWD